VASLCLTLLRPPSARFTDSGRSAPHAGAKELALLAFLALETGPHSREELAGLLWGESSESEARASLRQALKHLRTTFGEIIQSERSIVALAASVDCDVCDFKRLVVQEPSCALSADIPRFLAGFSVRHAPQFDEWVAATRRQLLQMYQNALGALAREAMGQWRWRAAVDVADRWLRSDPLSDEAARLSIEARYLAGDRGAALARFAEYRAVLASETGCKPSRTLMNLIHRVESDAAPLSPRPITDEWYARAPSFESSLIGREKEWGILVKGWKRVALGSGQIVLIEGEPGVGKSRLAEEFLRWVVAQGGGVLRGHGYDGRVGIPYEPVVEVLREALASPGLGGTAPEWLSEVTRLLPELRQRFPAIPELTATDSAEGWRLFEGVAQLMLALAAERPLVVWLDDLQWCDGDSCNLLRFLARRSEQAPILWLGTLSMGELERAAPAARLCRVLRAKAHSSTVTLGPLSEDHLWQMIREMGHVSTPTGARRFANRVHGVTGGNPFYTVELLKTMFAQGLLEVDESSGEWAATSGALTQGRDLPISQTVHEVIAARIDRLPEQLNQLLITIAIAGAGCRTEVLSQVHGISRLHAAALADALVDRRLLVEEGGLYRCAHPVIAHVVRDGLTPSRRREIHRTLALSLEQAMLPQQTADAARELARHADRGGEPDLAHRFALVASEAAIERYAFAEALSWLDLAASNARGEEQTHAVNRRTADVLEAAGWSEAPPLGKLGSPITRELEQADFDLTVKH
jgi:DNA-binding SARP family transcriptional activator